MLSCLESCQRVPSIRSQGRPGESGPPLVYFMGIRPVAAPAVVNLRDIPGPAVSGDIPGPAVGVCKPTRSLLDTAVTSLGVDGTRGLPTRLAATFCLRVRFPQTIRITDFQEIYWPAGSCSGRGLVEACRKLLMLEDLNNYRIRDGFLRHGSTNGRKIPKDKVRPAGLEPATPCLEGRCSIL
jgi:hypothetical protein